MCLAGFRGWVVYRRTGGLLGAFAATLPNATLPCDELPLRGGPMWWPRVGAGEGALYRADRIGLGIKVD